MCENRLASAFAMTIGTYADPPYVPYLLCERVWRIVRPTNCWAVVWLATRHCGVASGELAGSQGVEDFTQKTFRFLGGE